MTQKGNTKTDWLKVIAIVVGIILSVVIAAALWAAKELLGVQVGLTTAAVLSLHVLPSLLFYFSYIRGQKNWKMYAFFLAVFLIAQAAVLVGTFGKRYFFDGLSVTDAFEGAMFGLLLIKTLLIGTVILLPVLKVFGKVLGGILALTLVVIWICQCILTALLFATITPAVSAAIFNRLTDYLGVNLDLPFAIND